MPIPVVMYLHGFLSSPRSKKAQQVADYLNAQSTAVQYCVPALPEQPGLALAAAESALFAQQAAGNTPIGLIGSSMGGFYATVLAQRYALRAVLINPSVDPQRRLPDYLGEHENPYTGQRFILNAGHIAELQRMTPRVIARPDDLWLLVQSGDAVLDYREAVQFYAACKQTVEHGGDHQFQGFERHLPEIIDFLIR